MNSANADMGCTVKSEVTSHSEWVWKICHPV